MRSTAHRFRAVTHALLGLSLLLLGAIPQAVSHAAVDTRPPARLDIYTVFDTSGRLYGRAFDNARSAASTYIRALPPTARVGVVNFGQFPTVIRDLSTNRDSTIAAIAAMKNEGDTPPLLDGVSLAADQFDLGTATKRQVLLVTDGKDEGSSTNIDELTLVLRQRNIRVDVLQIDTPEANPVTVDALSKGTSGSSVSTVDFKGLRLLALRTAEWSRPPAPAVAITPKLKDRLLSSKFTLYGGLAAIFAAVMGVMSMVTAPKAKKVRLTTDTSSEVKKSVTPVSGIAEKLSIVADRALEKQGKTRGLNVALERAGLNIRPGEFIVISFGVTMVAGAIGWLAFGGVIGAAALGSFIGIFGMRFFIKRKAKRRSTAFGDQLSDTLQLLASSLRAGQGLMQAIDSVAKEGDPPACDEFRRVVVEARLGRDLIDSLKAMSERIQCEDFDWVIPAIEINREVGGDLAEVLDTVASTIRDRADIRRQVKTLSAEGRLSAYVLLGLPIAIAAMVRASNPSYIAELQHGAGLVLAIAGILMMVIGGFWLFSLCKIEF